MKYIEEKSRSGIVHKKYTSDFGKKILEKFGWNEYEYITYIYITTTYITYLYVAVKASARTKPE